MISLTGMCIMLYLTMTNEFVKDVNLISCLVGGWVGGCMTVGGIALLFIWNRDETIEKLQNNAGAKI